MSNTSDRRRVARFRIRSVTGAITTPQEAEVLDLSMTGALVEHQGMLRVNAICFLDLPTSAEPLSIRCRVVHSRVSRREAAEGLYYRTGVEFLDLSPAMEQALAALIRSYGAPAGEGGG
jgi:c-di-GMP-binding flagellar brake protein YcgR